MVIEFSIDRADLVQALKPFFGGKPRAMDRGPDYIFIKAQADGVDLTSPEFSSSMKAEVTSSGRAAFPFPLFERLFQDPQKLAWTGGDRLSIRITQGQIQAGPTTLAHPDVSAEALKTIQSTGLPVHPSLADRLAMNFRFHHTELADSGLLDWAFSAYQQTSELIDQASRVLEPLEITREELNQFVYGQVMKKKALPSKLSPEAQADTMRFLNRMAQAQAMRQAEKRQSGSPEKPKSDSTAPGGSTAILLPPPK